MANVFSVTKQLIGAHAERVSDIKEMALRYIEDKCAGWVIDNGGFVSMSCLRLSPRNRKAHLVFVSYD